MSIMEMSQAGIVVFLKLLPDNGNRRKLHSLQATGSRSWVEVEGGSITTNRNTFIVKIL